MLEKVGQFAQQAALNVSRRQFLGRFAGATAAAAALGGLLAVPGAAHAARRRTLCSATGSSFYCTNTPVGYPCGTNGKCAVIRGTTNDCYCRQNPGGRRR